MRFFRPGTFRPCPAHGRSGFTLFEFIIALVVLAIAAAIFTAFITPAARSADPMIMAQARAIAGAYMDEILLQDFGPCTLDGSRGVFDTIACYDGLDDQTPLNQFGDPITALSGYNVQVTVNGGAITVTVSHDSGIGNFSLQSFRGDY